MSGALLYVYVNESNTSLASIYTDFELTTPAANPVEANTSGQFPPIFAEAGTEAVPKLYRVAVTTADGGSPGNAFVFDNYRPSVDYDTATAALAESAAQTAHADAQYVEQMIDAATQAGSSAALAGAIAGAEAGAIAGAEAVGGAVAGKADVDGGNITPTDGELFRERIEAGPIDVVTYQLGLTEQKRLVVDKLRDFINAQDAPNFDAVRAFDARTALEALFAKSPAGGTVYLPPGDIYVSGLTVPAGIELRGAGCRPAQNDADRTQNRYGTTLWVNPAGTINLLNMASIEGVQILNPQVKYPAIVGGASTMTYAQVMGTATIPGWTYNGGYGGIPQFSGTAITVGGDDTLVKNCLVIGFNRAYYSAAYFPGSAQGPLPGPSRQTVDGMYFDCTNGVEITNCWDIPRILNCNAWNFYCAHVPGLQQWQVVIRNGNAYHFHDKVDGLMMTNCFGLGWDFTYRFKNIYCAHVTGCTGDGAIDTSVAVFGGAGLLTEGDCNGLHLNNVRCDGNRTNFRFSHTAGMVDGSIISGTTSVGTFIEVGAFSNGFSLDVTMGGSAVEAIRVRDGARNMCIKSLTCYLFPNIGEIVKFDTPANIKNMSIGLSNIEQGGFGVNSYGFRVRDKIVAGGLNDGVIEMRGAASGAVQVAAFGPSDASIDVEARGEAVDSAVVSMTRRTLAGVRQVLARFDAWSGAPASFLFRSTSATNLDIAVESVLPDASIRAVPKGAGTFEVFGGAAFGSNFGNFIRAFGRGSGSYPEIRADGADTNAGLDLAGKGNAGVRFFDWSGATRYPLGRFVRSSDIAASAVVNAAADNRVVYGVEGGTTNVTCAIAGKGTGGVALEGGNYADNAAAAAAGVPVGAGYWNPSNVWTRRV